MLPPIATSCISTKGDYIYRLRFEPHHSHQRRVSINAQMAVLTSVKIYQTCTIVWIAVCDELHVYNNPRSGCKPTSSIWALAGTLLTPRMQPVNLTTGRRSLTMYIELFHIDTIYNHFTYCSPFHSLLPSWFVAYLPMFWTPIHSTF